MQNKLCSILKDSLSFPYCSATTFYYLNHIDTPLKFWSNCGDQARRLKNSLFENWFKASYIEDILVGRHRSILCEVWQDTFYLNPYLMHEMPVLLDSLTNKVINSYPMSESAKSIIHISKEGNILNVMKLWPNTARKDSFSFNIGNKIEKDLTYEDHLSRAPHPEQKNLSLRVIDIEVKEVFHVIFDFLRQNLSAISSKGKFERWTIEFNDIIKKMARIIDSSPWEIEDYIMWAFLIREEIIRNGLR
ncbi:MAG: hypothetical protein ACD_3C00142G0028 [uncultured bacterium (gcode 4)]|uniref:Uncharacterized protein n=1 Tax=uncultured bacterium (gcode 4) TaxID=1234023 RepID=K2G102_9BACT|nr:MAG: hypothetical protein ACD_3C00142G0028 [uncultured bacterium (gcode 4)]